MFQNCPYLFLIVGRTSPNQLYDPAVGLITLINMPSVVVFPLPLGPSMPKTWPAFTSRFKLFTAVSRLNFLVRLVIDKTVSTHF